MIVKSDFRRLEKWRRGMRWCVARELDVRYFSWSYKIIKYVLFHSVQDFTYTRLNQPKSQQLCGVTFSIRCCLSHRNVWTALDHFSIPCPLCSTLSCIIWISYKHHLYKVAICRSCNALCPSYPSGIDNTFSMPRMVNWIGPLCECLEVSNHLPGLQQHTWARILQLQHN